MWVRFQHTKYTCVVIKSTDVYHQYEVHALLCCHSVRLFSVYFLLCVHSDENFPEKFKSENFVENFPFFYKDFLYCYNYVDIYLTFHSDGQMN
jgi:hypothetical protein